MSVRVVTANFVNGAGNARGTILADYGVDFGAFAYAALPSALTDMVVVVTDSTTNTEGATITGGGAYRVLAYYNGTDWVVIGNSAVVTSVTPTSTCDGRLTATTGVPVTTADVSAAASVYYTPYIGNQISLYDGSSAWNVRTFTEITISLAALTASTPCDVFAYDNAGTVTIETLIWTNATTRATALAYQNGVLVKSGATTRRYLGTVYINATGGQTDDTYAKRYVWNYYNRVTRPMRVLEATDSWAYTTATMRQANGNAANQLDFVVGVAEDEVSASVQAGFLNNLNDIQIVSAIGLDSTSAAAAGSTIAHHYSSGNRVLINVASLRTITGVGRHILTWLEYSQAAGATTWYGDMGAPTLAQSGIAGSVKG